MQNINNNSTVITPITVPTVTFGIAGFAKFGKAITHRSDLIAVLALLCSAGAYCVFALLHVG